MLALIAGTGDLPGALVARLAQRPLICAMDGFAPDGLAPDITFRLEHLGSFLNTLIERGVTRICMAGAVRRPTINPAEIDPATLPLISIITKAVSGGDDGALRAMIGVLEDAGLSVVAADQIAPDLLLPPGVPTRVAPLGYDADAVLGQNCVAAMGRADSGQACVVRRGTVLAQEGPDGTDAMLIADGLDGGILFKAPKPGQDRRADLPLIGPVTVTNAAQAGLTGIVIEAGGVMVLDGVVAALDAHGMFLWVRPAT